MTEHRDSPRDLSHLDPSLEERVRESLDRSVEDLDEAAVGRLRAARREALDAAPTARRPLLARWGWEPWLIPTGAAASIAVTMLAIGLLVHQPGPTPFDEADDLELLTSGEDLELLEDLDFYRWLGAAARAG